MNVQIALLGLALTAKVPYLAHAQNASEHPNWPSAGQLFVGTFYQPIDRSPQKIDQDIAIMKHAGFNVVHVGDLSWDSLRAGTGSPLSGSTRSWTKCRPLEFG